MRLTIHKRLVFCAAHRLYRGDWTPEKNTSFFGQESQTHGHNYVADFEFSGPIDPTTGMVIELSKIKDALLESLIADYDHHFLNHDTAPFTSANYLPSLELIARELCRRANLLFLDQGIGCESCTLEEIGGPKAQAFRTGLLQKSFSLVIPSVAQRIIFNGHPLLAQTSLSLTCVFELPHDPMLSYYQNERFILDKLRVFSLSQAEDCLGHCYLEQLASLWWPILSQFGPLSKIILTGIGETSCVYTGDDFLISSAKFSLPMAHCLQKHDLPFVESEALFGQCTRLHGHTFEVTVSTKLLLADCHLDTLPNDLFYRHCASFFDRIRFTCISDHPDFLEKELATCERLIFWIASTLDREFKVAHLFLQETPNNAFELTAS